MSGVSVFPDPTEKYRIVTSASMPLTPYPGLTVYQSDTKKTLTYHDATVGWQPAWGQPWGVVGIAARTTNVSSVTTVTDAGVSVTWTAVAGRIYKTSFIQEIFGDNASQIAAAYITDGSNNVIQRRTQSSSAIVGGFWYSSGVAIVHESGLSGSVTRKGRIERNAGSGNVGIVATSAYPAQLIVEDLGPA